MVHLIFDFVVALAYGAFQGRGSARSLAPA
jgi:hypothetical protein